jgi:glycopeptide antibiotics resistance protein
MAWLGNLSSRYDTLFNRIFSPEWMHWLMHAALYAGLAVFVIWVFEMAVSWRTLGMVILTALMVGLIQEGLQVIAGVQELGWNTFFDLCVDTLGSWIGFGVAALGNRKRRPEQESARR